MGTGANRPTRAASADVRTPGGGGSTRRQSEDIWRKARDERWRKRDRKPPSYPELRVIRVNSGRVVAVANPNRGLLRIWERSCDDRSNRLLTNRKERVAEEERKRPVLSGDQGENVKRS